MTLNSVRKLLHSCLLPVSYKMCREFIAYYRVSTDGQGNGLKAQADAVEQYVQSVGGKLVDTCEEHASGADDHRPILTQAIRHCTKFNVPLVVSTLDRLSRDQAYILQVKKLKKLAIICVDQPDLFAEENFLNLSLKSMFAQHERELISKRTKAALTVRKRLGVKLGSPIGFTAEHRRKSIARRKEICKANHSEFDEFISLYHKQGLSAAAIVCELRDLGLKTERGKLPYRSMVNRRLKVICCRKRP